MIKKEIGEFKIIEEDLWAIAESPCFNDEMRNNASDLLYYIREYSKEDNVIASGKTWVGEYKGIDYLWVDNRIKNDNKPFLFNHNNEEEGISEGWKPFSEIEISDELGKLRPRVHYHNRGKQPQGTLLLGKFHRSCNSSDEVVVLIYNRFGGDIKVENTNELKLTNFKNILHRIT